VPARHRGLLGDGYAGEEEVVTAAEWNNATDPQAMLAFLRASGRASDRKLRLFAVACCRAVWHLLGLRQYRKAILVGERYAEGQATARALEKARRDAYYAPSKECGPATRVAHLAVVGLTSAGRGFGWTTRYVEEALAEGAEQAPLPDLLRCVVGNPFRATPFLDPAWLAWNDRLVRRLAEAAYEERELPAGTLDPARLGVLADALEEAGCTDAELLGHLRGPGPHVRGCWVLDLLLDEE
jgi:hypothetical protein